MSDEACRCFALQRQFFARGWLGGGRRIAMWLCKMRGIVEESGKGNTGRLIGLVDRWRCRRGVVLATGASEEKGIVSGSGIWLRFC